MFGIVLTTLATLMHVYVWRRAGSLPSVQRRIPRKLFLGAGAALWLIFMLGRFLRHHDVMAAAHLLGTFSMVWLIGLFQAAVYLLAADLITGFGLLLPKQTSGLRSAALILAGVFSLIALAQGLRPPSVSEHEVRLEGLPKELDGTVLLALSDLHLGGTFGAGWMRARIEQIKELRPDIIVLTGDIFDGHGRAQGELLAIMRKLSAPLGVWAVTGNHEAYGRRVSRLKLLEATGFTILRDAWAQAAPGLLIAGVDDLTHSRDSRKGGPEHIKKALRGRPAGAAILLSHTPWYAEDAAKGGAGLMLSGHTHGGQVWPFGYLVRLRYPLLAGRYAVDGMPIIVSRGTGVWGPPMRLWKRGEMLKIVLRSPR